MMNETADAIRIAALQLGFRAEVRVRLSNADGERASLEFSKSGALLASVAQAAREASWQDGFRLIEDLAACRVTRTVEDLSSLARRPGKWRRLE